MASRHRPPTSVGYCLLVRLTSTSLPQCAFVRNAAVRCTLGGRGRAGSTRNRASSTGICGSRMGVARSMHAGRGGHERVGRRLRDTSELELGAHRRVIHQPEQSLTRRQWAGRDSLERCTATHMVRGGQKDRLVAPQRATRLTAAHRTRDAHDQPTKTDLRSAAPPFRAHRGRGSQSHA